MDYQDFPQTGLVRIAHTQREVRYPTMAQAFHAFCQMPNETEIERRNKAIFAFVMLTAARDGAMASITLKRIDLVDKCVYQDARDVNTKGAKTFTTWFMPVDPAYYQCFEAWVNYLREVKLFGNDDALIPKPIMGLGKTGGFVVAGLSREPYANGHKICEVTKQAFSNAGLPVFTPHGFRKTLAMYGDEICTTREAFKAWSLNIGHTNLVTTVQCYMPVSMQRQKELIKGMVDGAKSPYSARNLFKKDYLCLSRPSKLSTTYYGKRQVAPPNSTTPNKRRGCCS